MAAAEQFKSVTTIKSMICTPEIQFAVNNLGRFLFINLLLDQMGAGDATVVTYTSEAHSCADRAFLDKPSYDEGKSYEKWSAITTPISVMF